MFIGLVFYITDGKAVFLFHATQLPCRSRVIILSTSSYHGSDVIHVRQLPGCMPGCFAVGANLNFIQFYGMQHNHYTQNLIEKHTKIRIEKVKNRQGSYNFA